MRDRTTYIGGGDIGVICGVGFITPFQLWQKKLGLLDDETSVRMRVGLELEDFILRDYEQKNNIAVINRQKQLTDGECYFFAGTIDGMTSPDVIIDAKTHSGYGFDNDELPASYQLQAQWYMMLTNSHAADFHVLHFALGDFRTYRVERDDVLIGDLRMIANKFWQHVQNGTPPDYTVGDNIAQWLAALKKPRDEFWADDEMLELIQAYKTASEIKNEAQKSADEHREKILNRMRCMPDVIIDPMTETVVVRIQKRKDGTFHMMKVV